MWSWNDQDPVNGVPSFHTSQGSTPVNLLGGLVNQPQDPSDAQNLTIGVNNVRAVHYGLFANSFLPISCRL